MAAEVNYESALESPIVDLENYYANLPFKLPKGLKPFETVPIVHSTHDLNYYSILGVTTSANQCDIRTAYNNMTLFYHPDRLNRLLIQKPILNSEEFQRECEHVFHLANEAWRILGDEQLRPEYDFNNDFCYDIDLKKKFRTDQELARMAIDNMTFTCAQIEEEESRKGNSGLIIKEAYYGVFNKNIKPYANVANYALGPYENVRIPIVNLIQNSKIMIQIQRTYTDEETLSDLPGFYDVAPGETKYLIIRYTLGDTYHQVILNDNSPIEIPQRKDIVTSAVVRKQHKKRSKKGEKKSSKKLNPYILMSICAVGSILLFSLMRSFKK